MTLSKAEIIDNPEPTSRIIGAFNYFFNRETVGEYERKWADVFEKDDETKVYWDREIETGRIKRAIIDIFFDSYFQFSINIKNRELWKELLNEMPHTLNHFGGDKFMCSGFIVDIWDVAETCSPLGMIVGKFHM